MSQIPLFGPRHSRLCAAVLALCALLLSVLSWEASRLASQHRQETRGVLHEALPALPIPSSSLYGVNLSAERYTSEADLSRALSLLRTSGAGWVRQRFPWADIEQAPGEYDWQRWDSFVAEARRQGLYIIAVVDTSPEWARRPADRDNRFAPPQYLTPYALFLGALARRYGEQITAYQIWDQPNIAPFWGAGPVDPAAYVRLLRVAAAELRTANPDAIVLSAALAPNTEPGGRNMSDVQFLRGMYAAGGRGYFDVVAAKAYGFWSGPEDRRVDAAVLNYSRLILLREEMARAGDKDVPIWAVEFGWNSVPVGWQGQPSPWGSDEISRQADRTLRAVQRARQEWAWLGVVCWAQLQPAAPADDPAWGFALLSPDSEPTGFYRTWQDAVATPAALMPRDYSTYNRNLALILLATLVLLGTVVRLWPLSPGPAWVRWMVRAFRRSPERVQWGVLGLALAVYYFLPWSVPSLVALAVAAVLIVLRLDIGLAYLVFCIPFFLRPKALFGRPLSPLETLTVLCLLAWLWHWVARNGSTRPTRRALMPWIGQLCTRAFSRGRAWVRTWNSLDRAVAAFVILAGLSLFASQYRGVSIREFRVVIIEPAILYFLLRQTRLSRKQLAFLADALVVAGLAVCAIGLYQYFVSGDVIWTEGVRRVHALYGSPNNLSLLLGRIIALAVAVGVAGQSRRRGAYRLALLPLLACLFLTYSRGGWLLSLPAALLAVGWLRGRRATLWAVTAIALCGLLLVPLLGTQRFVSLLDFEQGTTFRRVKLWQAAWAMVRDHPITGIGLDNFLYRYPEYMLPEAWEEPGLSHPHNIVLDFWTRLGIGGVLVLLWLTAAFFALAIRLYRHLPEGDERAIILGWIAVMVSTLAHGLIDNSYFLVDLAYIFFLGLGWVQALAGVVWTGAARGSGESSGADQ